MTERPGSVPMDRNGVMARLEPYRGLARDSDTTGLRDRLLTLVGPFADEPFDDQEMVDEVLLPFLLFEAARIRHGFDASHVPAPPQDHGPGETGLVWCKACGYLLYSDRGPSRGTKAFEPCKIVRVGPR